MKNGKTSLKSAFIDETSKSETYASSLPAADIQEFKNSCLDQISASRALPIADETLEHRLNNPAGRMNADDHLDYIFALANRRLENICNGDLKPFDLIKLWSMNDPRMEESVLSTCNSIYTPELMFRAQRDLKQLEIIEAAAKYHINWESSQSKPDYEQIDRSERLLSHANIAKMLGGDGEEYHLAMRDLVEESAELNVHWHRKYSHKGFDAIQGRLDGGRIGAEKQKQVGDETRKRICDLYNNMENTQRPNRAKTIAVELSLHVDHVRRIIRKGKSLGMI